LETRGLLFAHKWTGKMIVNGHRRIRMGDKNWRSGWVASIFLSRYESERVFD
jgi:hypothetical protein